MERDFWGSVADLLRKADSGDPLSEDEQRFLLKAVEQLLIKAERQEKMLSNMQRSKYKDMLLSGVVGWTIGFAIGLLLRILGLG